MALQPTQGDENRSLSGNRPPWKGYPPLCHLDRSAAKWRGLCVDAPSWKCVSTERTRSSYLAELAITTYAALRRESRTSFINATTLNRKSGGA
jgi:hypothetical protein